jgi:hypothetical protein
MLMCIAVHNLPRQVEGLGRALHILHFSRLCQEFLESQQQLIERSSHVNTNGHSPRRIAASTARIRVYTSAIALFYAPSDPSGIHGMKRERIHCTAAWRGRPREDCVLVKVDDEEAPGGIQAARIKLFFTLTYQQKVHECALVHWYSDLLPNESDPDTGMRVVSPSIWPDQSADLAVISLDSVVRAAHLMPVFGPRHVSDDLHYRDTLNTFQSYYLNCYIDHHMYELFHK